MALRFRRELRDKERDGQRPDHRHQDHEWPPRARWGEEVGVVADGELPEEEQIVHQSDEFPESYCTEPSHDPDPKGQDREVWDPDAVGFLFRTRRLILGSDMGSGGGPIGHRQGGLVR